MNLVNLKKEVTKHSVHSSRFPIRPSEDLKVTSVKHISVHIYSRLPAASVISYFVTAALTSVAVASIFASSSGASIGRFSALNLSTRKTLIVVPFVLNRTNLRTEFNKRLSKDKMTHVLQPMTTFGPLSLLVNTSSVPRSCLMTTRYLVGACLGRESLIEICVTSTNLNELVRDRGRRESKTRISLSVVVVGVRHGGLWESSNCELQQQRDGAQITGRWMKERQSAYPAHCLKVPLRQHEVDWGR